MGFTIYYRSTVVLDDERSQQVRASAEKHNQGHTWLSCEPVNFFLTPDEDGRMFGGSKPNFSFHPDDVAAAKTEQNPDGTVQDLLEALCQISRECQVDWEISHDHEPDPIGYIHQGKPDGDLVGKIDGFSDVVDVFAEIMDQFGDEMDGIADADLSDEKDDDEDDPFPPTIKLFPDS